MTNPLPTPAPAPVDARTRALRVLAWGLLTDVLIAVGPPLADAVSSSDFAWSAAYWRLVGLALAKTAVMASISYVMRRVKPPATT